MFKEHVTDLTLAALLAAHIAVIIAAMVMAAALMGPGAARGWRRIMPGGSHWFAAVGSWAFSLLIGWVWLFVGSARCDAEEQMGWAYLLTMGFAIAAAYTFAYMAWLLRRRLQWNGNDVAWRAKGADHTRSLRAVTELQELWSGSVRVRFADGATILVDPATSGANELLHALAGHATDNALSADDDLFR